MHSECLLLLGIISSIIFPLLSAVDPGLSAFISVSQSALQKSVRKDSYQLTQEKNLKFILVAFQKTTSLSWPMLMNE